MVLLHAGSSLVRPPVRYPDLWPALFALASTAHTLLAFFYALCWQLSLPDLGPDLDPGTAVKAPHTTAPKVKAA